MLDVMKTNYLGKSRTSVVERFLAQWSIKLGLGLS